MTLAPKLTAFYDHFITTAPADVLNIVLPENEQFFTNFKKDSAIQVGDILPPFSLSDAVGNTVTSSSLLAKGPLLITFYRGHWCPYCNLALHALQERLEEIQAKGVTFVAITPELPDFSLSFTEKAELKFPVLTDKGTEYAKKLGILWPMPQSLKPIFKAFDHDLDKYNGNDSLLVPVPATILVDSQGVVKNTFINPDFTKRVEPAVALEWIDALVGKK